MQGQYVDLTNISINDSVWDVKNVSIYRGRKNFYFVSMYCSTGPSLFAHVRTVAHGCMRVKNVLCLISQQ